MSEDNEELEELMAIVKNEQEVEDEEQLTEEELQQALSSPSLHRHLIDEESTECDEYDLSSGEVNASAAVADEVRGRASDKSMACEELTTQLVKQKPGEYQFQMLEHHIFKGKHGKKLYKCDVCFAVYRHSFSLKRHFIRSHINYGYLCETDVTNCGINLAASASLQTWKQQTAGQSAEALADLPELYCCHSCVLFFDDLSQIKGHVDDCHRNNSSGTIEPIRIPCSECNMSFIQRHNLMRHIEVVHNGKRLYACKHCSKKFQTIADRKKHEKSQHPNKQEDSAEEPTSKAPTATTTGHKSTTATHRCLKCSQLLANYAELRSHVTRRHKEFFNACGFCNKFFYSKKQLATHLRQKHEKTVKDNVRAVRQKAKQTSQANDDHLNDDSGPSTSGQNMSQQNQSQAYFHCSLCYRRFLTYGSLIRHKQIAHRPQHVRNCSRLTADRQIEADVVEPYNTRNEFEFYRSLAQKVAENLLYYVDGKFVNPSNDYKVILNPSPKKLCPEPVVSPLNLSKYNFPVDFRHESSPPPTAEQSDKLEFLLDCNLNTVKNPKFKPLIVETGSSATPAKDSQSEAKCLYICSACQQKISEELMPEHEANNHPNVYCTYIKVEPQMQNIPSQLLLWQYHSTEGLLHRCPTAPSLVSAEKDNSLSVKCTKCQQSFASVSLLHNHILECAHNSGSKKKSSNNSKSHNNVETQTPGTAAVTTTNTSNTSHSTPDSLTETIASHSSDTNEKDFTSPLSPCKTRSGKRRQITPEDYVKTKRTRNSSKSSSNESSNSKTRQKSDNKSKESEVRAKNEESDDKFKTSKNSSPEPKDDGLESMTSTESLPKRYSCKKCSKKFVYMDSLSKHQMSCNQRVFNSKVNTKRKLRNSTKIQQKIAKNLELKALKSIQKRRESHNKSSHNSDDNHNESTADESEDKTEEEEEVNDNEVAIVSDKLGETICEIAEDVDSNSMGDKTAAKESPSTQEHQCPDCLKVFIYFRNFRKHITNGCPIRKQLSNDSTSSTTTPLTSTPLEKSPIKLEKTENDDKEMDCTDDKSCANDEDVVFDGEHNGEEVDDSIDASVSAKEESKLDLWRVKQENPQFAFKGSPAQHHSCPYCQRGFTYLANYRKHIKNICPIRLQIEEKKKQVIDDNEDPDGEISGKAKNPEVPPTLVYTPSSLSVRSQIEDTVLTILRDQTKQNQILQSSEDLINSRSEPKADDISCGGQNASDITDTPSKTTSIEEVDTTIDSKGEDSDKTKDNKKESQSTPASKGSTFKFRTFSCSVCHKIFFSYVSMLKHKMSHKLVGDGSSVAIDCNTGGDKVEETSPHISTDNQTNDGPTDSNRDKEAANQALAASILKRSKEVFGRLGANNAVKSIGPANTRSMAIGGHSDKAVINTTDLLEKLARGGIADPIQALTANTNTNNKSSTKGPEVVTIETNNNNTNIVNLQLSASTSNNDNNNSKNNNNHNSSDDKASNSLDEIIISADGLNVLNDNQVIVSQDLQQLIAVNDGKDGSGGEHPVNEVLLNLDDIENANEVWITITDSNAYVQVPDSTPAVTVTATADGNPTNNS